MFIVVIFIICFIVNKSFKHEKWSFQKTPFFCCCPWSSKKKVNLFLSPDPFYIVRPHEWNLTQHPVIRSDYMLTISSIVPASTDVSNASFIPHLIVLIMSRW